MPPEVDQLTPDEYRSPEQVAEGGVLVVGASATGVQLAAELQESGRPVTLAVGEHVRLPRPIAAGTSSGGWTRRGCGTSATTRSTISRARGDSLRRSSSARPSGATLDLNALTALGVELVGRLAAVRDGRALFSGGLRNVFALADLKLERLLASRRCARRRGSPRRFPERFAPTQVPQSPRLELDLAQRRDPDDRLGDRLPARLLVARRARRRCEGPAPPRRRAVDSPGLYALGLPVLRRRKSTFIHGIEDDAREVIDHLRGYLA